MANCKILWDNSVQAFRVSTPYNPNFVELLKQIIPIADRVWDPQTKIWTLHEKYGVPIFELCKKIYGAASVQYMDRAAIAAAEAAANAKFNQYQAAQQAQAGAWTNQYQAPPPPRLPVRGDSLDVVLLNFVKLLPYDAAQAAYRKAAMALHPDKPENSGNSDRMSALNACWARIEAELYRKGSV